MCYSNIKQNMCSKYVFSYLSCLFTTYILLILLENEMAEAKAIWKPWLRRSRGREESKEHFTSRSIGTYEMVLSIICIFQIK